MDDDRRRRDVGDSPGSATDELLMRARKGDRGAVEGLAARFLGPLKRWARGRLPGRARDLFETDDLVQETFRKALDKVEGFEAKRPGAFLAYLRRAIVNRIRDEIRRSARIPARQPLDGQGLLAEEPSPLEAAVGRELHERYEKALARLTQGQREAVILRIELGLTHEEVAEAIGSPSPNAARMSVARGLVRIAELLNE